MDPRLLEEIREFVYRHGVDATLERYAPEVARWPGEPAGIWIRVSSGEQDEANQVPQTLRLCAERGYRPAKWYVVHGKSAFHGKHQKDLDEALADGRRGEIKALFIWHSSRIERRKGKSLLDLLAEFNDAGVPVRSVQEPQLGQEDIGSQVTTYLAGLMNYDKSLLISEQVKLAQDRIRANNGTGNRVPWGYFTEGSKYNRTLVATPICVKYAPQIFQRCADGDSLRTIAKWLDTEGVPTTNGKPWNEGTLRHLIMNRTYAGRRTRRGDTETYQRCQSVVSMDLFERANKALKDREKRGPKTPRTNPVKPMLAKLRCYRCGSPMYRHRPPRQESYDYRCFGSGAQRKGCGNSVPYDRLENMVVVRMLAWNDEPHQTREWKKGRSWDAEIADVSQDIRELAQDPTADRWIERMAEFQAQVVEYKRKNDENRERGHWEFTDTGKTIGQHFYDLDDDGRREYLKTHDIRAEKMACCGGTRVIINGREDVVHKTGCPMEELVLQPDFVIFAEGWGIGR